MIKIVTAFFDIGRCDLTIHQRSDDKYFEYFRFWARLKNDLTVYCQSCNAKRVLEIRKEFGLESITHVKIIDHYTDIEPDLFKRMLDVEQRKEFQNFRYFNTALSNQANYDYLMLIKWWCLQDAAAREEGNTMMAWLDFGYNHGGERYSNPKNFDFEWNYPFESKVNAFCLKDPSNVCAIDYLQFQTDCFIGHTVAMPAKLTATFWQYMKDAMDSLLSIDCIDDDQLLILMVYKKYPELFQIRICNWFEDLSLCSDQYFETTDVSSVSIKQQIRKLIMKLCTKNTFMKRTKERKKQYW